MTYIHKKTIGAQNYYYLRISERKGDKVVTKDICYLGNDISKINLEKLEEQHHDAIRKSHRTLKSFLESNKFEQEAKELKPKKEELLTQEELVTIEATKIHYRKKFLKLDEKTRIDIIENFLIRFAVNSTAIEGNTISLKDAARLLQENILPKNNTIREVYDLTNTKRVFYDLMREKPEISPDLIIDIHDKLLENIDNRKGFRNHDIHILGQPFKPTPAKYVAADIKLILKWYENNKDKLHPFILATLFHHKFESIHPFSDGNGRTGRILMNHILLLQNYPPIVVNKKDRKKYLDAMNQADKAVKTSLISTDKMYEPLTKFMTYELQQSYWDIFLF
jgi:fido (protein-threonine AMPylation protein)